MGNEIGLRVWRAASWLAGTLLFVVLAYATAGLIGGTIPINADWKPPATGGVRILVEDNGIHTGLVLPVRAAGIDWSQDFPAGDITDPRYARFDWVAVGWGDRAFYVETPTWADVNVLTVLRAATGSTRTVLHVEHVAEPPVAPDTRAIMLSEEQYRKLAAYVRATRGPGGKVAGGYGVNDVFYDGRGRYSAIRTCNEWAGGALRGAGVRIGAWTPFPVDVMAWF
ncbi:MAG: TIGR02117 family protein [Sphingomonas sp.]|uniref:TIGR02117 family protein n=1 Tax=Sphingomonas sp. TaxID=28214 RepID=UPI003F7DD944